jgi:hypothetical protein
MNLMPFEEYMLAVWALRATRGSAMLDLFGLVERRVEVGSVRYVSTGEVAYVLRGQDTSLIDLIAQAKRWWTGSSGSTIGGRPVGSGTWASAADFEEALRVAARRLNTERRKVTQENVAEVLHCNARSVNRWLKRYGIKWNDIRKAP